MCRSRIALSVALALVLPACRFCDEDLFVLPQPTDQVDLFAQKAAARVDILWVVDNSDSMVAEQNKVAGRFSDFFKQLLISQVDYHIGVVTTDPRDGGKLRTYGGPAVNACTTTADSACRFITKDVPCDDPDVDLTGITSPADIETRLLDKCPAQLVFRKLVTVGTGGTSFEEGFVQAAAALGANVLDAQGFPDRTTIPAENAGFLRDDASLYIVFVSDEDEGAKREGSPIRYYQRLYESLKGAGNENKVSVATITGFPIDDTALPPIADVCSVLRTTFDTDVSNDDPRAAALVEALRHYENGCEDVGAEQGEGGAFAETGGRYIELACRTGGVITNMCEEDYSAALDALGANAAGLLRKFTLSHSAPEVDSGPDCKLFTADDPLTDCDNNGDTGDEIDAPVCVKARALGSAEGSEKLIKEDPINGWQYEESTNSIRFDGRFIPAPGSSVEIRYTLRAKGDAACTL